MLEAIDPAQLAIVTGGNADFHPGLVSVVASASQRKRVKPDAQMQTVTRALGESMSNLTTSISQSQQQQSQQMAQALPQLMQRR